MLVFGVLFLPAKQKTNDRNDSVKVISFPLPCDASFSSVRKHRVHFRSARMRDGKMKAMIADMPAA